MSEPMAGAPVQSLPPWIQRDIQQGIAWRDGDVVISVPPKSGTTWTMNIVYQLFTGGNANFRDVYEEVPWIEFLGRPDQPHQEVIDRVAAMPTDRRRAFKTHSAPPEIPFIKAGDGPRVSYIVVFRNPEEALVSFWPFLAKHSDAWADLWGMPHGAMARPDFASFYADIVEPRRMHEGAFFQFLNAWWPLRHESNVLFLHYSDMKRDHEGSIRKIADFLGIDPSADQWERIVEYTSFDWMKRHEHKFEAWTASEVPILDRGAMMRQGVAGNAKSDGMTDAISAQLRALGEDRCSDRAALNWFYKGGALP